MANLFDMDIEPTEPADRAPPVETVEPERVVPEQLVRPSAPRLELVGPTSDLALMPVVEILPDDFKLPTLIRFVPDTRLRDAVRSLESAALAIDVTSENGLALADDAVVNLRGGIKKIEADFEDPTAIAFKLHKRLTTLRAEYLGDAPKSERIVSQRIVDENDRRAKAVAAENARAQEVADADARANAAKTVETATANGARPEVIDQLKRQASTAVAPPVSTAAPRPAKSTGEQRTWKARFKSTAAGAEAHPTMKELTDGQRADVINMCKGIIEGKMPIAVIKEIDWAYLDKRANGEMTTFALPGFEAFEHVASKAKPASRRS